MFGILDREVAEAANTENQDLVPALNLYAINITHVRMEDCFIYSIHLCCVLDCVVGRHARVAGNGSYFRRNTVRLKKNFT
jgi:hypothetical protein